MEILRRIPMQGKLLACSTDIEHVLNQLEGSDTVEPSDLEAEIKALRNATELKIQAIESQISTKASKQNHSDRGDGISWQAVDRIQTNVESGPNNPSFTSGEATESYLDSKSRLEPVDWTVSLVSCNQ
ncbi:hypothetical protein P3T76_006648 [Phytophthora citrophthora]|uniref:Uncharacterized protein n=1 Tax=Phytophthora citrophthora TaxID=4793 RepID=A0AAD9GPZ0_9STRA|nr:hypothetical protein P3T76_006648 [Phytophthora citrophthora]